MFKLGELDGRESHFSQYCLESRKKNKKWGVCVCGGGGHMKDGESSPFLIPVSNRARGNYAGFDFFGQI